MSSTARAAANPAGRSPAAGASRGAAIADREDAARFERKFLLAGTSRAEVESRLRLHPAHFREIHAARWVNSLYFDDPRRTSYRDNVDGVSRRLKLRVRWYGTLWGTVETPVLEVKRKSGQRGWKEAHHLPAFRLEPGATGAELAAALLSVDLPGVPRFRAESFEPVLLVRYRRRYFQTFDRRFRATVDDDLEWYAVRRGANRFRVREREPLQVILELKYAAEHDEAAARITAHLPFRLTRSSKYVQGVDRLERI